MSAETLLLLLLLLEVMTTDNWLMIFNSPSSEDNSLSSPPSSSRRRRSFPTTESSSSSSSLLLLLTLLLLLLFGDEIKMEELFIRCNDPYDWRGDVVVDEIIAPSMCIYSAGSSRCSWTRRSRECSGAARIYTFCNIILENYQFCNNSIQWRSKLPRALFASREDNNIYWPLSRRNMRPAPQSCQWPAFLTNIARTVHRYCQGRRERSISLKKIQRFWKQRKQHSSV